MSTISPSKPADAAPPSCSVRWARSLRTPTEINQGQELIEPKPEHGLAESILYMQRGTEPSQAEVDGLNAYMVAVAEHGLNVSTFAARVTVSTDSDMVSGLTSAVGGLKGPKHGGVPGPVL